MRRKTLVLGLALVLALAPAAFGQPGSLTGLGPVDTVIVNPDGTFTGGHGFPTFIEDKNNVALDLAVALDPVILTNPFSVHTGFGGEGFYFLAQSSIDLNGGGQALLDLGVEAAYGAEDPMNGDQFLFVRTRIRIDTPVAGTYKVYHPWGVETFEEVPAGDRGINFTYDWGGFGPYCPDPEDPCISGSQAAGFERILTSPKQGPFLLAANASATCIGDGTPGTVTGSEVTYSGPGGELGLQNFFRVEGPAGSNLGGQGGDAVQTDQFTVLGHIFGAAGTCGAAPAPTADVVTITRARFVSSKQELEIRATSSNNLPMNAAWFNNNGLQLGNAPLNGGRLTTTVTNGTPTTVRVTSTDPSGATAGATAEAAVEQR